MTGLQSNVSVESDEYATNRGRMLELLDELALELAKATEGGGQRYVERHRQRGKLLARERIDLLLDRDAPFLELSALTGWGTSFPLGGSVITGLGPISGVECVVIAHDPTVRGGAMNPYTLRKVNRAMDIARENRLPLVNLVESGGADLPTQAELFVPAGSIFRDLTQLSALGIPTISLVFGNATAGGAYVPGMSDYVVMVSEQARVFLAGPPLVKMATGEEAEAEELGGADMHGGTSGLADFVAADEVECLSLGRDIIRRLDWRKSGFAPSSSSTPPRYDAEELLGVISADPRAPFDPREILARVVDDSEFDEFKPRYGTSLVTGWTAINGYPVGVLANHLGVLFNEDAEKAAQFIQLANQIDKPLLFLQNTTGYMVGREYERAGIVKDGAKMINAVANSRVPHLTLNIGSSFGAGNYGMCGRAFRPRFLFAWPNARLAVMGAQQLAGVLSIVARDAARARGVEFDLEEDQVRTEAITRQIDEESTALFTTGQLFDDGIIDPRDTRTVLTMCLSAIHGSVVQGATGFGVFRM